MLGRNNPHASREASHDIYFWESGALRMNLSHRRLPNRAKSRGRASGVYPLDGVLVCVEYDKRGSGIVLSQLCQMSAAEYDREIASLRQKYERHFRQALEAARFRLGVQPKTQKVLEAAGKDWAASVNLEALQFALHDAVDMYGHTLVMDIYRPKL